MEFTISTLTGTGRTPIHTIGHAVDSPRGNVAVVHGVAEHAGRYVHVFEALNAAGFDIHALDHRGHGRSGGRFGLVDRWRHLVDDLETFLAQIRAKEPSRPLILVGHSMGALACASALINHHVAVDAAVLSGIPLVPTVELPGIVMQLSPVISTLAPTLPITELDSADLSHDPAVVEAYDTDPYVYRGRMLARTGDEILKAVEHVKARIGDIDQPVLLAAGGDDRITSAEGSRLAFDGVGSTDKDLRIYDGFFHEIFNEVERDRVIAETVEWIAKHA